MCLAAALIYASTITSAAPGFSSALQEESRTGRELFRFLALGNTLAWLLIAPALTATGLAKEREQGLLESLWLSPFRVGAQVWGRLGAALCFLLVLQVATLPIYGIAALLGGVSLGDIGLSGLIIAMGALAGAAFGLWCSARSYRGSSALGAAFFGIVLWGVAAGWVALDMISSPRPFTIFGVSPAFTHPVAMLWILLSPNDFTAARFGTLLPISTPNALLFGLTFQFLLSMLLIWSAIRKAARPLPEMRWSQGNERLKKWRARVEGAREERRERREAARTRETVASALLYEVPVERFVRFKDPLLEREVRGRFRLRRGTTLVSILRFITFLVAIGFWLSIAYSALDPVTRRGAGLGMMLGLLTLGTLAIGVMSSGALVREREAGTWEGLHLSLLSPWQIVRAKWLSPLATLVYWSTPFWVLLPLYFNWQTLGALIIVAASLASVSAWGLHLSGRAPHSAAATSWTLATLLVAFLALPALDSIFEIGRGVAQHYFPLQMPYSGYGTSYGGPNEEKLRTFEALWNSYHPFISIGNLFENYPTVGEAVQTKIVALSVALNALLTAGLLSGAVRRGRKTEF